jgi:hypothetical protein
MGKKMKIFLGILLAAVFSLGFLAGAQGDKTVKNAQGQ